MVELAVLEVCHRSHHSCSRAEEVETGVLASFGYGDVTDFKVEGNSLVAFSLEFSKQVGERLRLGGRSPTNDSTVELNDDGSLSVKVRSEDLGHSIRSEQRRDLGHVERGSDEFTSV